MHIKFISLKQCLECIAIREAIKYVKMLSNIDQVLICTDSQSIITAINGFPKNKKSSYIIIIMEIIDEILILKNNNKFIKFLWMPSHSGIKNNERVDQLARESLTLDGPYNHLRPSDWRCLRMA